MTQTDNRVYYLESILRNLREYCEMVSSQEISHGYYSLGQEILSDNIDWLDCYIDQLKRELNN